MTTDPPKGIKANLKRTYSNIVTQDIYDELQIRSFDADKTQTSAMTQISERDKKNFVEK